MPTARHARLVRKIRREEERAARQRAESSLARGELVRQLVAGTGSQQAAAQELGISRQAVNKAVQAGEDAWDDLRQTAPALTYLPMSWPKYGAGVVRDEEWAALNGTEAVEAANTAREAWEALERTLDGMHQIVNKAVAEVTGLLNGPDMEDLPWILDEGLKPGGGELQGLDYVFAGQWMRPRNAAEVEQMQRVLLGMRSSLHRGVKEAREQQRVWAARV